MSAGKRKTWKKPMATHRPHSSAPPPLSRESGRCVGRHTNISVRFSEPAFFSTWTSGEGREHHSRSPVFSRIFISRLPVLSPSHVSKSIIFSTAPLFFPHVHPRSVFPQKSPRLLTAPSSHFEPRCKTGAVRGAAFEASEVEQLQGVRAAAAPLRSVAFFTGRRKFPKPEVFRSTGAPNVFFCLFTSSVGV